MTSLSRQSRLLIVVVFVQIKLLITLTEMRLKNRISVVFTIQQINNRLSPQLIIWHIQSMLRGTIYINNERFSKQTVTFGLPGAKFNQISLCASNCGFWTISVVRLCVTDINLRSNKCNIPMGVRSIESLKPQRALIIIKLKTHGLKLMTQDFEFLQPVSGKIGI